MNLQGGKAFQAHGLPHNGEGRCDQTLAAYQCSSCCQYKARPVDWLWNGLHDNICAATAKDCENWPEQCMNDKAGQSAQSNAKNAEVLSNNGGCDGRVGFFETIGLLKWHFGYCQHRRGLGTNKTILEMKICAGRPLCATDDSDNRTMKPKTCAMLLQHRELRISQVEQ